MVDHAESRGVWKQVLLLVLGVLVLLVLFWGGLFVVNAIRAARAIGENLPDIIVQAVREAGANMTASREATEAFLNDLAGGQADAAYARTSSNFQRHLSLEGFREATNLQPNLRKHSSLSFHYVPPEPGQPINEGPIQYEVTMKSDGDSLRCTLRLIQENNSWKVDHFTFINSGQEATVSHNK